MEATELIAELADALYTLVPTCFCHAKHCGKCENWEAAKKLIDQAATFTHPDPSDSSVNTPRPPQDTPPALPWQPGPAAGGGLPPESAAEVLIDWYGKREVVVLYEKDWITNMAFTGPHPAFYGSRHQWQQVRRWLVIK
jgi:hypothetical protein